jgi:hypothetical protein
LKERHRMTKFNLKLADLKGIKNIPNKITVIVSLLMVNSKSIYFQIQLIILSESTILLNEFLHKCYSVSKTNFPKMTQWMKADENNFFLLLKLVKLHFSFDFGQPLLS